MPFKFNPLSGKLDYYEVSGEGPAGPTGATGPAGEAGAVGATGATGPVGESATTGKISALINSTPFI